MIDETLEWIKGYVARLAEKKQAQAEPIAEAVLVAGSKATLAAEASPAGEINAPLLAESPAAGKP
jgi:hypothetical protein